MIAIGPAIAADRVALVVGSGRYQHAAPLANPANDARAIAASLQRLGFDVDLRVDLDRASMYAAIKRLIARATDAEAAVFYYAGHGARTTAGGYLIPVDAAIETEFDLDVSAVRVADLVGRLGASAAATLIFLDACRNDPFDRRTLVAGRAVNARAAAPSIDSGIGTISAGRDMFVAYATGSGDTASDGTGRNSPFTKAMLDRLEIPGLELRALLRAVRDELATKTEGQIAETSDRLRGEFYFKHSAIAALPVEPTSAPTALVAPPVNSEPVEDLTVWQGIQSSTNAADFELFLRRYPSSRLADWARARIALLSPKTSRQPVPPQIELPAEPQPLRQESGPRIVAAPLAEEAPPRRLWVLQDGAAVRAKPSSKTTRLASLQRGAEVTARPVSRSWYRVALGDGQDGFIAANVLSTEAPASGALARAAGTVFRDCTKGCPELVAVAAGNVIVGSSEVDYDRDGDEGPTRVVRLAGPLAIGRHEVTFAEWDACVAGGGCDGYRPDDDGNGRGDRPVADVSYSDALTYIAWLSRHSKLVYRLLSEAEWEYAAKAGRAAMELAADDPEACSLGNGHDMKGSMDNAFAWTALDCDDGWAQAAPAGKFRPNALGLQDLLGNVWEWVEDCYASDHTHLPANGRSAVTAGCDQFVIKGGSWRSPIEDLRAAARESQGDSMRTGDVGFRVVRDLTEGLRGVPTAAAEVGGPRLERTE